MRKFRFYRHEKPIPTICKKQRLKKCDDWGFFHILSILCDQNLLLLFFFFGTGTAAAQPAMTKVLIIVTMTTASSSSECHAFFLHRFISLKESGRLFSPLLIFFFISHTVSLFHIWDLPSLHFIFNQSRYETLSPLLFRLRISSGGKFPIPGLTLHLSSRYYWG